MSTAQQHDNDGRFRAAIMELAETVEAMRVILLATHIGRYDARSRQALIDLEKATKRAKLLAQLTQYQEEV